MRRLFLTVHKWIGICLGVFMFLWLTTGIVMILPSKPTVPPTFNAVADLSGVGLSPAVAATLVPGDPGAERSVRLIGIGGQPFYEVAVKGGARALLDGRTGSPLVITAEVAESLARLATAAGDAPAREVTQVKEHSLAYPAGPLPAFRIVYGDAKSTIAHVAVRDGSVRAESRLRRLKLSMGQLHSFDQIRTLTESKTARDGLLHISGVIGLFLVLTGYFLALPKRWFRRSDTSHPPID